MTSESPGGDMLLPAVCLGGGDDERYTGKCSGIARVQGDADFRDWGGEPSDRDNT